MEIKDLWGLLERIGVTPDVFRQQIEGDAVVTAVLVIIYEPWIQEWAQDTKCVLRSSPQRIYDNASEDGRERLAIDFHFMEEVVQLSGLSPNLLGEEEIRNMWATARCFGDDWCETHSYRLRCPFPNPLE